MFNTDKLYIPCSRSLLGMVLSSLSVPPTTNHNEADSLFDCIFCSRCKNLPQSVLRIGGHCFTTQGRQHVYSPLQNSLEVGTLFLVWRSYTAGSYTTFVTHTFLRAHSVECVTWTWKLTMLLQPWIRRCVTTNNTSAEQSTSVFAQMGHTAPNPKAQ